MSCCIDGKSISEAILSRISRDEEPPGLNVGVRRCELGKGEGSMEN
jgi:hypothetical protein